MKKICKIFSLLFCALSLTSCSIELPSSTIEGLPGEIYSSIIVCLIGIILFFIIFLMAKKADPLKKPKGLLNLVELCVTKIDEMVENNMGKRFNKLAPYIMVLYFYILACFLIGLIGVPSPITYYMVPFSLALITFLMIHITNMKYAKWGYFKRYVSPFPIFLPINLLSMWAPLLSMSFRLLGNAIAGMVLMNLFYSVLEMLSESIFGWMGVLPPLITPLFHAYFDLFSGFIQTTVFCMLTMLLVAQEGPQDDELSSELTEVGNKK